MPLAQIAGPEDTLQAITASFADGRHLEIDLLVSHGDGRQQLSGAYGFPEM